MEEFNLDKYNTGEYDVVTRDGRSARILCTDANIFDNELKILALVKKVNADYNVCYAYKIDGTCLPIYDINNDLILVKKKWKPQKKEEYWVVSSYGEVVKEVNKNSIYDNKVYDYGNCFRTREEAKAMAEKIKKLLNEK